MQETETVGVGIDFGTSNSVAALFDGTTLAVVDFGQGRNSIPSATYLNRDYQALTGQEAIDEYIADNIGRRVELAAVKIGEARTSTGQYDDTGLPQTADSQAIYSPAMFDVNLPGRLFYGTKQLLASLEEDALPVFEKYYRLEAIITPILLRIRQALANEARCKFTIEMLPVHVEIGRPVNFEFGGDKGNERAVARLCTAFGNAGFTDQEMCFEPVAAAMSYLNSEGRREAGTVMTVDFGGGTLDFSILRAGVQGFSVLGTYGIGLGGNHVDQTLFRALLFPLLGRGSMVRYSTADGPIEKQFPFENYADFLLNWPVSYTLNQNSYITPIREIIMAGGKDAVTFQRLLDLIQFNYSYLIFDYIRRFKECFSTQEQATLDIPELDITLTLEREEFDRVILDIVQTFEQAMQQAVSRTGLREAEIDRVICVGGSTQIPAIKAVLQKHFPDRVVEHDIFTSVASGLAIQDYHRRLADGNRSR